ncbi:MAG TPA: patatin-like phospholipase family protein [Bradyrhizobium sp.]|nr:patatin-like phospholipase family protein [Bradyrhizobium sp.]
MLMTLSDVSHHTPRPIGKGTFPGQIVLVMQGGGAPGSYQAGVYQALHEAGIEPDWVVGTSIGAINGAIIVGNHLSDRVERLKDFWERLDPRLPAPWCQLTPLVAGVPGFYCLNPALAWGVDARVGIERAAMYLVDPLKKLLPAFVDFNLINAGTMRFTLGLAAVETGDMRYFDSQRDKISLEHVLGSSALPPSFPAVPIEGEYYWDGGIYSNSPIEVVFDDDPRQSSVVFATQIWRTRGPRPESLAQALMREKDILFGSHSRSHILRQAELHQMRRIIRELVDMLPEDRKDSLRAKELAGWGCATTMHLVEINAQAIEGETYSRDYDFSREAMRTRWRAGYTDARRMLERRPWDDPIDPATSVTVYRSDAPT